jgi:hypothetical protein
MPYTDDEFEILGDRHFLLTKRKAIDHTVQLLADVKDSLKDLNKESYSLPDAAWRSMGKISKGENYRGLPFVVLDYPSLFERKNILTFRTMFWWGHYFAVFVMCSGEMMKWCPLKKLEEKGLKNDYFINTSKDFWNFDLDNGPFIKAEEMRDGSDIEKTHNSCSVARRLEIKDYKKLPELVTDTFMECFS